MCLRLSALVDWSQLLRLFGRMSVSLAPLRAVLNSNLWPPTILQQSWPRSRHSLSWVKLQNENRTTRLLCNPRNQLHLLKIGLERSWASILDAIGLDHLPILSQCPHAVHGVFQSRCREHMAFFDGPQNMVARVQRSAIPMSLRGCCAMLLGPSTNPYQLMARLFDSHFDVSLGQRKNVPVVPVSDNFPFECKDLNISE